MRSLGNMIKLISGLTANDGISEWEENFIESVFEQSNEGKDTTKLSDKQVLVIERIYNKHFT